MNISRLIDLLKVTSNISLIGLIFNLPAQAQIIPDATLPINSVVPANCTSCTIEGGTVRGTNLFHSFERFSIPVGGEAFFNNAPSIQNILTRVTGNLESNINGIIRANGTANLFLINPRGITFGINAQLQLGGSFVASTASSLQFPDGSQFSAVNPQAPPLLVVNPSALLFNQLNPGAIKVQSQAPAGNNPFGNPTFGLRVPDGQSLLLVGGTVTLSDTGLRAYGGRVELAGVSAPGTVQLVEDGTPLRLQIPANTPRSDIALTNSNISGFSATNGDIGIYARNIKLENANLFGGIAGGLGFSGAQAGDITLDASDAITLQNSQVDAGVESNAIGKAGNIILSAKSLTMTDGTALFVPSLGRGDAGNVVINVQDTSLLDNSIIFVSAEGRAVGNGGVIQFNTGSLSLLNGAQFVAINSAQGNPGSVLINARDRIFLDGRLNPRGFSSLITNTLSGVQTGQPGDIRITTGSLELINGAQISTGVVRGRGDGGDIIIQARGGVALDSVSSIINRVELGGVGNGGDITISADSLSLTRKAQIVTSIQGTEKFVRASQGNAGNITLNIRNNVTLRDFGSQINSGIGSGAVGNGGAISMNAGSLALLNEGAVLSSTEGQGNAGRINLRVRHFITMEQGSAILSLALANSTGQGGDISIRAGSLLLSNTVGIGAATAGQGNAGNIGIEVQDTIRLHNSGVNSGAIATAVVGSGGDITISTGSLIISNGLIGASRIGQGSGKAGNIRIAARDTVSVQGKSSIQSLLGSNTIGRSGDIAIAADAVSLTNGAGIFSTTVGQGDAGNIQFNVRDSLSLDTANIFSSVERSARGKGGNINIRAGSLLLNNNAQINSSTFGWGDAGEIRIEANDRISLQNSSIVRSSIETGGVGNGGDISIQARTLALTDGSQVATAVLRQQRSTQGNLIPGGQGRGGSIQITTSDSVTLSGLGTTGFFSGLITEAGRGSTGAAGNITVNTDRFDLRDGAIVNASTNNSSNGGDIAIVANHLTAIDGGKLATRTGSSGNAGSIWLNISGTTTIAGSNPNYAQAVAALNAFLQSPAEQVEIGEVLPELAISGIFANSTPGSSGRGGTIQIITDRLNVLNQAEISVNSQGNGVAGNVNVIANNIQLRDRARISAETASVDGGNIRLNVGSLLLLRDQSTISTTAGTIQAGGNGGNIRITSPFIIAVLNENSDIAANAFTGRGGRVDIFAQSIFGIQPRSRLTSKSDITASSQFGIAGTVTINTLNTDPNQGLTSLPTDLVDPADQIDQRCTARSSQQDSSFTITGRGGVPSSPTEPLRQEVALTELVKLPETEPEAQVTNGLRTNEINSSSAPTTKGSNASEIVEATRWVVDTAGNIQLIAKVMHGTHLPLKAMPTCDLSSP